MIEFGLSISISVVMVKGAAWKQSNLDRLKRSFIKELNKRQIHWQEDEFEMLLAGYNDYFAK